MSEHGTGRPRWGPKDYWHIGPVYAQKQVVLLAVIALSIAALLIFGPPFPVSGEAEDGLPSYRYDAPELTGISGPVRVLDDEGRVRYVGEVAAGAYTGRGRIFDADGALVYDGPLVDGVCQGPDAKVYQSGALVYTGEMAGNLYEGRGRRVDPAAGIVSEGQFSGGLLEGQGREFYADGTLLREGVFSRDLLEGEGREYSREGVLLREGTFSAGLLHGEGREYTAGGKLRYEGQFWRGLPHGQGVLYDTALGVRTADGTFAYGELTGLSSLYHPSGQLLYTGQVLGPRPRADAFLGLSLAEVEEAFAQHWVLYTCEETTAFVYPYFNLMFVTESPVELISPTQAEEEARQGLLEAAERPPSEPAEGETSTEVREELPGGADAAPSGPEPSQPPVYDDEQLSPVADKRSIVITRVLSFGQPLPGAAQPDYDAVSGRHRPGWREWFSDFALGGTAHGASVCQSGQFVWRFAPQSAPEADEWIEEFRAESAGVETVTAQKRGKDMPLWYQTAEWRDSP